MGVKPCLNSKYKRIKISVYCLDFFSDSEVTKVVVVTSDYHVDRTKFIFTHVFNKAVSIEVYGVPTTKSSDQNILLHEQQSLDAFCQTFKGVDFSDISEIFSVLSERHPFYNGKIHTKVS